MGKEVLRVYRLPKHDVIVEVEEVFGQAWNLVQLALDGRRAECRQVALLRGKELVVSHYGQSGCLQVQPSRYLAIGDYEDMSDPRGKLLQRSQGVA